MADSSPTAQGRRSRSMEAAREMLRPRIEKMDARERIGLALRLGRRAAALAGWHREERA